MSQRIQGQRRRKDSSALTGSWSPEVLTPSNENAGKAGALANANSKNPRTQNRHRVSLVPTHGIFRLSPRKHRTRRLARLARAAQRAAAPLRAPMASGI